MPNQYHLSKERHEELKKELETLKGEGRADIADKLKRAKEYGDLSENAEYAEAREEQNLIENRIFELEELLKKAVIIEEEAGGTGGVVRVGCAVTVKKNGKETKYTIVGPYDAKPEEGKISDESPLGRAFMGHEKGDEVTVLTPSGKSTFEIIKIE
ncbi:MAG: transcription elongation factor GreA [Candidatus Liptonbacteria bacterium]|nr:transcription elongation factor GreA [Candidatus Liptonbacteria bacterium]